jgi:DUF1680 family protein
MKHEDLSHAEQKFNREKKLSRRVMLKLFGGSAVAAAASMHALASSKRLRAGSGSRVPAEGFDKAGKSGVRAFDPADVRLLDGPFRQAQERDANYLIRLEPDRLLHNFRVNAGLIPKAPVYGGWESVEPWVAIRCQGHSLGHYLSACSLMFAATGDQRFRQRVDYIVAELRDCQDAGKSGLICAFPDGDAPLVEILSATRFVGVPWYTMHKIFAGLRDAYQHAGNRTALDVLIKLSDWAVAHTRNLSDQQFQKMLDTEHGGMNEVLADVCAITGEKRVLTLAERFCHQALLTPLAESRDTLDGLHSNTQIPKVIGFSRLYELTGRENYRTASNFFWQTVVSRRTFATGGNGDGEHFFPPADFLKHLGSAKTMETCCTHNMLKLTRSLFAQDPNAAFGDYYERALYNSILGSQDPDSGMMTYFQPVRPGYLKLYCTPTDSFWCCTGTGMENHAKYGDSIYFHDADTLYVNLFIASKLTWKEKGITITQTTRFPDEEGTRLQVAFRKPAKLTLKVRQPFWCAAAKIKVNGRDWSTSSRPGTFISVNRTWRTGDVVDVQLPMKIRTEALPGNPDTVAVMYGPLVLAGRLGRQGLTPGADIIVNERTYGDVLNERVDVPMLKAAPEEIVRRIKRSAESKLAFQTVGIGSPNDVSLIPYYRIAHERYNIYWKTISPAEKEQLKKA